MFYKNISTLAKEIRLDYDILRQLQDFSAEINFSNISNDEHYYLMLCENGDVHELLQIMTQNKFMVYEKSEFIWSVVQYHGRMFY